MSEHAFIDWIRRHTPSDPRVLIGPGDDAAVLPWPADKPLLVTTDMLLEGSCFKLAEAGARRVGRKAMGVNLSDIAAMAGKPVAAVVSVGLPRAGGQALATDLYDGLRRMADEFETAIVGGDTNSWNGPLVISVTLLGEATGRGPVTRGGARSGDWLFVTGPLGGSILGKHLEFTPRVREALRLHELVELRAMIDISDGLAVDLHHICKESRCGAVLREETIPISEAATMVADSLRESAKKSNSRSESPTVCTPLDHALGDGEDFELLFAVSPADGRELLRAQPLAAQGMTLVHIGECIDEGTWLEGPDGRRVPLPPMGYVHEFS
jgi:thiamine-monophosphate kinase